MTAPTTVQVDAALTQWLRRILGIAAGTPCRATHLAGGNSNETLLLTAGDSRWVLRRPPVAVVDGSAHSMRREYDVLQALVGTGVPAAAPLGYCDDPAVTPVPVLLMSFVDGRPIADKIPAEWSESVDVVGAVGSAAIDALVALHAVDWQVRGLSGLGRPDGYLERQVPRWRAQRNRHMVRQLPAFEPVADWLEANRPPSRAPALLHGDYHLDNCLFTGKPRIRVVAIIDWELATVGDPLVDLGLFLAFWGPDRPEPVAMPQVQGVSRTPGAPSRRELAARYARGSGRSVADLDWYMCLALFKLAAIVEGAYAQYLAGNLDSDYARNLEHDVPRLLGEAAAIAGLG